MPTSKEVKEMLFWTTDKLWYTQDPVHGYRLTSAAPQEAHESFRKWAQQQDSQGDKKVKYTL